VAVQKSLGEKLLRQRKWSDAVVFLERVLAVDPKSLEATNALATSLGHLGEKARAAEEFRKARELSRQELALHRAQGANNRGLELWYAGNLQEAAVVFRSAIGADPDYSEAHNNLGGVLWQMKNPAGALAEFQAAVRCRPNFAEAYNNWGNVLVHDRDIGHAIKQFRAALGYRPGFALARLNLGRALAIKREVVEAEAELRRAVTLAPEMAAAHIELGVLLASKAGSLSAEARAELNEGLRLDANLSALIPPQYARELH